MHACEDCRQYAVADRLHHAAWLRWAHYDDAGNRIRAAVCAKAADIIARFLQGGTPCAQGSGTASAS